MPVKQRDWSGWQAWLLLTAIVIAYGAIGVWLYGTAGR